MLWKKCLAANLIIIAAAFVCGALCLHTTTDLGIADLNTVEAYLEAAADVSVERAALDQADSANVLLDEDIENVVERLNNYAQSAEASGREVQIMIVEPLSELTMCGDVICVQRAVVKKVIKGEPVEGECVEISRMGGMRILDGQMSFVGFFPYRTNLMLPGQEYLVFCSVRDDLEALKDYGTDYWKFEAFAIGYSSVCLTECENVLLSPDTAVDWKNNEFLAYHQETIDGMIRLKEAILEQYMLTE